MGHKGHYGEYTGNARHSRVTNSNMAATKRDDEAHMEYLKDDIDYDNKHGHSDSSMTSDEKHISKLAGDLKYDEKKHGSSPAHKKVAQERIEKPINPNRYKIEKMPEMEMPQEVNKITPIKPKSTAVAQMRSPLNDLNKDHPDAPKDHMHRNMTRTLVAKENPKYKETSKRSTKKPKSTK